MLVDKVLMYLVVQQVPRHFNTTIPYTTHHFLAEVIAHGLL